MSCCFPPRLSYRRRCAGNPGASRFDASSASAATTRRTPGRWASAVDREAPFYFTKSAEHYVASGSTVPYPPGTSNYHYELELVVVIGAPAFRVTADRALDCVFGYACGLDMTRRDLQSAAKDQRRPWDLGKDVEQSAVLSEIVPASGDRPSQPPAGSSCASTARSSSSADISQLIHKVPEVIAHLSAFYHLHPGDLIYTGTPEGVGPVASGRLARGHDRGRRDHHADDRSRRIAKRRGSMLKGCVPWPEEFARRYIEAGLWEGITVAEMVERTARRQPQKIGRRPRRRRGSPMKS